MIINPYFVSAAGSTPSSIPNIWEWWEPSREGLANNDPIGQLTGQVSPGTGHNWTQSTGINKPVYLTNQLNGLGVLDNSSSPNAQYMGSVNPSALTASHFFIVVKSDNDPPVSSKVPWALGNAGPVGGNPDSYPFTNSHILSGIGSTTRRDVGDPAPLLTSWRVVEVVCISTEWTFRLDGSQLFTTATNTVGIPNNCALCAQSPTVGGFAWDGQIAGLYIFSAKLTGADRTAMVTYLNSRFGLSIT